MQPQWGSRGAVGSPFLGLASPTQHSSALAGVAGAGPPAHPSPSHRGLVRGQTYESMEEVHPHRCARYLTQKKDDCWHNCCKEPEFGSIPAEVGRQCDGCSSDEHFPCPWDAAALASPNPSLPTVLEVGSGPCHPLHLRAAPPGLACTAEGGCHQGGSRSSLCLLPAPSLTAASLLGWPWGGGQRTLLKSLVQGC